MATFSVEDHDFDEKVLKNKIPVLVDFWAPWCSPCRMAEPILEELSDEYENRVVIVKVNVDENKNSSSKYSVLSIPTTVLFKEGKEVGRQIGFAGKVAYENLIKKATVG
ncbi:thioredoxin [Candidatus Woesebacteria bacterium RIFCSPLOWO2_01_FULL_39_21]|uniref:Thioredoxin n=1 Tax=Candidatus Woesebacteria bacterium RIFCSPLOWO2_01_FULL_39_21 TaxID=1802519 RepID=A0A1F8BET4_9BACT|nr:MAG: thioredoxin [Candidatus Woesebacteria bacterium RIFCSPHIGHO2_01_FULL_39_23]OGM62460.1 MAG: thioredoxin [Candidatus Woesebacteria bacterium RIFCSPLOWO2_01_FULL_39_21]